MCIVTLAGLSAAGEAGERGTQCWAAGLVFFFLVWVWWEG